MENKIVSIITEEDGGFEVKFENGNIETFDFVNKRMLSMYLERWMEQVGQGHRFVK